MEEMERRMVGYIGRMRRILEGSGRRIDRRENDGVVVYEIYDRESYFGGVEYSGLMGSIEIRGGEIECILYRLEYNRYRGMKYMFDGILVDEYIRDEDGEEEMREKVIRYVVMMEMMIDWMEIYCRMDRYEKKVRIEMI